MGNFLCDSNWVTNCGISRNASLTLFSDFFRAKPKAKRAPPSQGGNRKGHEKEAKEKKHEKSNDRLTVTREATGKERQPDQLTARVGTSGNLSERSESIDDADKYVDIWC